LSTHLRLSLSSGLFWLSHQYPICIPLLPHSCYMLRPSNILCDSCFVYCAVSQCEAINWCVYSPDIIRPPRVGRTAEDSCTHVDTCCKKLRGSATNPKRKKKTVTEETNTTWGGLFWKRLTFMTWSAIWR
jgi:hypothetical protein